MISRLHALLLASAVGLLAQIGIFGPVTSHPQAGDLAPEVTFAKVLMTPPVWISSKLFGQTTVLAFFPDTTDNLDAVDEWNERIDQFSSKPVQFVWITAEKESSLEPWLAQHFLKGVVLFDPDGATGRAYGIERPVAVLIGPDGRIIGFDREMVPSEDTLNAGLEGRITTTPPGPGAAAIKAFRESGKVLLEAEAPRIGRPERARPNFPPSYIFHVLPSQVAGTGEYGGMDFWSLQGFDVKGVAVVLYDINRIRIELPASFRDDERYDYSMVLPTEEGREQLNTLFRQGIEDHFHIVASRENRLMDVYVVTAENRQPPPAKARNSSSGGDIRSGFMEFESPDLSDALKEGVGSSKAVDLNAVRGIGLDGTMDEFCHWLERQIDRPVVNETHLQGNFHFDVRSNPNAQNDFLDRLRDQSGLVITPAQRDVEMLVFKPR